MWGERRISATGQANAEQPVDLGEISRATDLTVSMESGVRLRLLTSEDGAEYLGIVHHLVSGRLVVDRDHASLASRVKGGRGTSRLKGRPRTCVSCWTTRSPRSSPRPAAL